MTFLIGCEHCGDEVKCSTRGSVSQDALGAVVMVVVPNGWTVEAITVDGNEPETLCPDCTVRWSAAQEEMRTNFVLASAEATADRIAKKGA
jgi:hypothetical protein